MQFTVKLVAVHGRELSDNARTAIEDQRSIAYLGELVAGTSQVSVEILNQQGLLEVSPADTGVYLTQPIPPVSSSPDSFYPARSTYHQTFARVVPNSGLEAKALVGEMQALGVSKLYVADDGQLYGRALALEVTRAARSAGLDARQQCCRCRRRLLRRQRRQPGARASAASRLDQDSAANPSAKLFAASGLLRQRIRERAELRRQRQLYVSSPGFLPKDLTAAGRAFVSDFRSTYGHAPAPQAIFGYEAMSDLLYVLGKAGSSAPDRPRWCRTSGPSRTPRTR